MSERKLKTAQLAEGIFCIVYLVFVFTAAIIFFLNPSPIFKLYGYLALVLGCGDAFHLIPRIIRIFFGDSKKVAWWTGLGLMVSSITMTIFYLILFWIWKTLFPDISYPSIIPPLIYTSVALRIILCLFPQNNWFSPEGNPKWALYRNLLFGVTGLCMIFLYILSGNSGGLGMWQMAIAIFISFACYFPVALYAKKIPALGMLMIPKTICYMWMIGLGLGLMAKI